MGKDIEGALFNVAAIRGKSPRNFNCGLHGKHAVSDCQETDVSGHSSRSAVTGSTRNARLAGK